MKPNQCPNNPKRRCNCKGTCNNITVEHIESLTDEEFLNLI